MARTTAKAKYDQITVLGIARRAMTAAEFTKLPLMTIYICGGAMRSRTSVPLCSLKFFFLAVITVVAGGLLRTQSSLSPSIPMAPLESCCRFDLGRFSPFWIAVCTAAPELASEVMSLFPVRCVGSLERFIE